MRRRSRSTFRYIIEGSGAVAAWLAAGLTTDVVSNGAVVAIEQSAGVLVHLANGDSMAAAQAVVAVPAPCLASIAFDPPLPSAQQALGEIRIDPGTKVVARLDEPPRQRVVIGGNILDAAWRHNGVLTGVSISECERDDVLIADLARAFDTQPGNLRSPMVYRWADRHDIGGCDVGFRPGELTALGPALRAHHGRVVFAGVERSSWPNNMEGAVASGETASRAILAGAYGT